MFYHHADYEKAERNFRRILFLKTGMSLLKYLALIFYFEDRGIGIICDGNSLVLL